MNPKKIQSVNPDRENFNFYHRKAAENENIGPFEELILSF